MPSMKKVTFVVSANSIEPNSGTIVAVNVTVWFNVDGFGAEVMVMVASARILCRITLPVTL